MGKEANKKINIPVSHTYMILAANLLAIAFCVVKNIAIYKGFWLGIGFTVFMLSRDGIPVKDLLSMIAKGAMECKNVLIIVFLMGANISLWLSSGTVPSMIYYGFDMIGNLNYLLAVFLICALISVFMGTAIGTLSTIGLALLGIGQGIDIPTPVLVGTIVSGVFLADRISPISGLVNLTMDITEISYRDFLKKSAVTMLPSLLISAVMFYLLGNKYSGRIDSSLIADYQANMSQSFAISPYLLAFPVIMMVLAIMGVNILHNMGSGVLMGFLASVFYQKIGFVNSLMIGLNGYVSSTGIEKIDGILKGGGALVMIPVILLNMAALGLNKILEETGMIEPVIASFRDSIKDIGSLVFKSGVTCIMLAMAACNQVVGIVFTGRSFRRKYEELGLDSGDLARTIGDTGTIIAPLFPWNVNAILIGIVIDISAIEYAPYSFYPIVSLAVLMAWGMFKSNNANKFANSGSNEKMKKIE